MTQNAIAITEKTELLIQRISEDRKTLVLKLNRAPEMGLFEDGRYTLSDEEVTLKDAIDDFKRKVKTGGGTILIVPTEEYAKNSNFFERVVNFHWQPGASSLLAKSIGMNIHLFSPVNERRRIQRIIREDGLFEAKRSLERLKKERDEAHDPFGKAFGRFWDAILKRLKLHQVRDIDWAIKVYEEEIVREERISKQLLR